LSLKDLEKAGLIRPQEEWGQGDLHSHVNRPSLMAAWVVAGISAVLMYVGNGGSATWVGLGGMLLFIVWFTCLSMHAVEVRRRAQAEREQSETPAPAAGTGESPADH